LTARFEDVIPNKQLRKAAEWYHRQKISGAQADLIQVGSSGDSSEIDDTSNLAKQLVQEARMQAQVRFEKEAAKKAA
jgi:hypothetical protein